MKYPALRILAVYLVPLLCAVVVGSLFHLGNHIFQYFDPDFGYLYNSLLIVDGYSVQHIDHPGTLLQWIGALVFYCAKFFVHETSNLQILTNHSVYIYHAVSLTCASIFIYSCLAFGLVAHRKKMPIFSIYLTQLSPLLFPDFLFLFLRISPETLIFSVSFWVAIFFLSLDRKEGSKLWDWIFFGLSFGFLNTLKATTWPNSILLLLPLAKERAQGLRKSGLSVAAMALTFVLILFPAWIHLNRMFFWMLKLFLHTENYGRGENTVATGESLQNGWRVLLGLPGVTAFLLFFFSILLVYFLTRVKKHRSEVLLFACTAAVLVFMIVKHPGTRYIAGFAPLTMLLICGSAFSQRWLHRFIFLCCLLWGIFAVPDRIGFILSGYRFFSQEGDAATEMFDRVHGNCAVTVINTIPWRPFALFSGNLATAGVEYAEALDAIFPRVSVLAQVQTSIRRYGRILSFAEWEEYANRFPCQIYSGLASDQKWIQEEFGIETEIVPSKIPLVATRFFLHNGPLHLRKLSDKH